MPDLTAPATRVHASFLAAMAEFAAEGRGEPGDATALGDEFRHNAERWDEPEAFAEFTANLRALAREETPRPPGFVPQTTLWWVDGDAYLGRLAIRHRLTEHLLQVGGHIGYDVRPSARRRGHATAMLRSALPTARGLGLTRVLLTCDTTNVASRRVIERCGGRLEDERDGRYRYWIET